MCAFTFGLPLRVCRPENTMREMLSWGLPPDREILKCACFLRIGVLSRMLGFFYDVHPRRIANTIKAYQKKDVSVCEWIAKHAVTRGPKGSCGEEWYPL
jgi:hypothetical protein